MGCARSSVEKRLLHYFRYSSAINEEIELAFRNGASDPAFWIFLGTPFPKAKHADIAIGIRSYEVLFEGASMAGKQVASSLFILHLSRLTSGTRKDALCGDVLFDLTKRRRGERPTDHMKEKGIV